MNKLFSIALVLILSACQNNTKQNNKQGQADTAVGEFAFQEEFHNFGNLQAGEVVAYSFQFENSGEGKLIINRIETDCGCIETHFPKEAVATGQKGLIEVVFNTAGETGKVYKELLIYSNTKEEPEKLAIAANVENEFIKLYSKN
ncbi:DUF1573 domain-containing protein [Sunxiuqinia elliptica]|uniref:Uncharacterized protein DUF1573 n=1 Tax=Sunxiuqinia elliptica TaxID=655355 RepID=A0A4R6GPW2_9BACT|nr:DUF1573 domain-containing protein [Sunxiuqinia elliptica]TDN97183.1 uncharacterized protein DUF1573 [Sunxiuqinia elliptica]TDO60633.1 uncharacterized protein DUF1573 [Sunxiuqinia elliptica]